MRVQHLQVLATAGVASRRGAEDLILQGKVKVNGKVVSSNVPITRQDKVCRSVVQSQSPPGVVRVTAAPGVPFMLCSTPFHIRNTAFKPMHALGLLAMRSCWQAVHASVNELSPLSLCAAAGGGRQGCEAPPDSEDLGLRRQQAQGLRLLQRAKCWRWVRPAQASTTACHCWARHHCLPVCLTTACHCWARHHCLPVCLTTACHCWARHHCLPVCLTTACHCWARHHCLPVCLTTACHCWARHHCLPLCLTTACHCWARPRHHCLPLLGVASLRSVGMAA